MWACSILLSSISSHLSFPRFTFFHVISFPTPRQAGPRSLATSHNQWRTPSKRMPTPKAMSSTGHGPHQPSGGTACKIRRWGFRIDTAEIEQLQTFTELAAKTPNTIKSALVKKNVCTILRDLVRINRSAFFLCTLGTLPYHLSRLKSTTYMQAMERRWR